LLAQCTLPHYGLVVCCTAFHGNVRFHESSRKVQQVHVLE
jgi:hypothetical protein